MVYFGKFVHTETGKLIMSILLGIGLASLFRNVCKGKNCVVFYAPPLENIEGKVYKSGDKCYKFQAVASKCHANKRIVNFE
jgi:hypothetical protein